MREDQDCPVSVVLGITPACQGGGTWEQVPPPQHTHTQTPAADHLFPGYRDTCRHLVPASAAHLLWKGSRPQKLGIKESRDLPYYQAHTREWFLGEMTAFLVKKKNSLVSTTF